MVNASLAQLPADPPVLFLPTQHIGKRNEPIRFPGTLTLSVMDIVARDLRAAHGVIVYHTSGTTCLWAVM